MSDTQSVKDSAILVAMLKKAISDLQKRKVADIGSLAKTYFETNKNLVTLNQFIETIDNVFKGQDDSAVVIDDKNLKALIVNMKTAIGLLEYLSDFLNLIIDVQKSKEDIKNGKGLTYTIEELCKELAN